MISLNKQLRSGVGLGLIGTVLLSATPAFADVAAPKDCGLPGTTINFAVTLAKRLDIAPGQAITLEPVPGGFAQQANVRVFCENVSKNDIGFVSNATVRVSANSDGWSSGIFYVDGQANSKDVTVDPTTGTATFTVSTTDPGLSGSFVADLVGEHKEQVVQAYGVPLSATDKFGVTRFIGPSAGGDLFLGATPELDSIALFGTGAMGMAGYAIMRMRAARGRREES